MKYNFFYGLCLFLFIACDDELDLTPRNSLTFKNALETEKDIESALASAGYWLRNGITPGRLKTFECGEYADEVQGTCGYRRNLSPQSIPVTWWDFQYNLIDQANVVLHFVDQIPSTRERREVYCGQAYFYKAFAYLDLIRQWGDCILIKDEGDVQPVGQISWVKVADHAIDLAEKAVALLPEYDKMIDRQGHSPRYKSTPCKGSANALLAHLCAWKAGGKYFAREEDRDYDEKKLWERAKQACTDIIMSGTYELADSPEQVCAEVLVGNSKESIFECACTDFWQELNEPAWMPATYFMLYWHSWPVMPERAESDIQMNNYRILATTVKRMFPEYLDKVGKIVSVDERRNAYFYKVDSMSHDSLLYKTGGFAYPYKYRTARVSLGGWSPGEFLDCNANTIWWRLADIILLRAECRARLDDAAGAIEDINRIRDRAKALRYDPSDYDGDVRYAVFKEREKELLLEGWRYYDVIRNDYRRIELEEGFQKASDQDFIDGAFFTTLPPLYFKNNSHLRQNNYWLKRQ